MALQAPSVVKVNGSSSGTITVTTDIVTVSWSGASYDSGDSIIGYFVALFISDDGVNFSTSAYDVYTMGTKLTYGEKTVSAPPVGKYMKYGVATETEWSQSDTNMSNVIVYRANPISKLSTPGSCTVSSTMSAGEPVTLSWGSVSSVTGNTFQYYQVQRSESSDGSTWDSWTTLSSTLTTNSLSVYPPSTPGNYYRYRVRALGSAGSSYYSSYRTSSNTLRKFHEALPAFTDTTLTAGQTYVKAVHITELQTGVNTLRTFYGFSAYSFSSVEKIADWSKHITELRAAVDEISTNHDTWLDISVNCPRVDVMEQLRTIILAL